jgi:5-methylthioadenosine/S-adenosylhomocysteine deaminase
VLNSTKTVREKHAMTPVGYLASIGFLGPRVVAAHGVWVNDDDMATMKQCGVGVSHNPDSNMKLASGTRPSM